jgi:hypothetical protein
MLIGIFGVVDVVIPFDYDFTLLPVLPQFCEASPVFAGVPFR